MNPPEYFTQQQKDYWETIVDDAKKGASLEVLEKYVIEFCRWQDAEQWLRENGDVLTIRDSKGVVKNMVQAPQLKIARDASKLVIDLSEKLGIKKYF